MVKLPWLMNTPPPLPVAWLFEIVPADISNLPPAMYTPAPEAELLVALLFEISAVPDMVKEPEAIYTPPPLSAVLPVIVPADMLKVPEAVT